MQRAKRVCSIVTAISLGLVGGVAMAQQHPDQSPSQTPSQTPSQAPTQAQPQTPMSEPTEVMAMKVHAVATVQKVDTGNRQLTLRDEQGNQFLVKVPAEVQNFDSIKKGDKIEADYYTTMALSLMKNAGEKSGMETGTATERVPGPLPAGMVANRISGIVQVVKVDKAANKVTIKNPSGDLDTIQVTDPTMQTELSKLKAGDKIRASYTEAVAISVMPRSQKQQ